LTRVDASQRDALGVNGATLVGESSQQNCSYAGRRSLPKKGAGTTVSRLAFHTHHLEDGKPALSSTPQCMEAAASLE